MKKGEEGEEAVDLQDLRPTLVRGDDEGDIPFKIKLTRNRKVLINFWVKKETRDRLKKMARANRMTNVAFFTQLVNNYWDQFEDWQHQQRKFRINTD